jgi:ribonuclease P protein component
MLPTKNRLQLREHQDFFTRAKKSHTKHFVIFSEANSVVEPRVAVIVPAKKVSLAVDRNKTKRVVRAALAKSITEKTLTSMNIVVYCKQSLAEKSVEKVAQEIQKAV